MFDFGPRRGPQEKLFLDESTGEPLYPPFGYEAGHRGH
jgi:hypothetical protein